MKLRSLVVLVALGAVGCASGKPLPIAAGETCYRCQRTIAEPKLAAALVDASGEARKFRTAGCLATYLKNNPNEQDRVFVTDYATGELFPVAGALFVRVKITDGTRTERDYLAFRTLADAKEAAARETSPAVDWAAVRAQAAASRS